MLEGIAEDRGTEIEHLGQEEEKVLQGKQAPNPPNAEDVPVQKGELLFPAGDESDWKRRHSGNP